MVATVGKSKATPRELAFLQAYAVNGGNGADAYRTAYRYTGKNADVLAWNVLGRPHIQAIIDDLRSALPTEAKMDMSERQRLLSAIARKGARASASASDAIAAIREHAHLAGERRSDGSQVNIGGDLNLTLVLQSLRAGGLTAARNVTEPAEASQVGRTSTEPHKLRLPGSTPGPASNSKPWGNANAGADARTSNPSPGRPEAVQQPGGGAGPIGPLGRVKCRVQPAAPVAAFVSDE